MVLNMFTVRHCSLAPENTKLASFRSLLTQIWGLFNSVKCSCCCTSAKGVWEIYASDSSIATVMYYWSLLLVSLVYDQTASDHIKVETSIDQSDHRGDGCTALKTSILTNYFTIKIIAQNLVIGGGDLLSQLTLIAVNNISIGSRVKSIEPR